MSDIKAKYPESSTGTVTISLASLATSSILLAGRESDYIDNASNLDIDHLLGGKIRVGTSPTANTRIEVWVVAPYKNAAGTWTWPDVFDGTDSAETITSAGVKAGFCKLAAYLTVDATTSDRDYFFGPVSVAALFGGVLPERYGIFVTHNTAQNLNSTGGNHEIHYQRVQMQTV